MSAAVPPISVADANVATNNIDATQLNQSSSSQNNIGSSQDITTENISSGPAAGTEVDDSFSNLMSSLYNNLTPSQNEAVKSSNVNEVNTIKSEMTPSYEANGVQSNSNIDKSTMDTLSKTFNYTVFANVVAQITSGISSTVKALTSQA